MQTAPQVQVIPDPETQSVTVVGEITAVSVSGEGVLIRTANGEVFKLS